MTTLPIYVDNSRRSVAEKCLRKRYWGYEYGGRGIEPIRKGKGEFPLLTGTGVHTAIEAILNPRGALTLDLAILDAVQVYNNFPFELDQHHTPTDLRLAYLVREQCELIDGITRAWYYTKHDDFLRTYEVLDIEREESVELAPGVVWMSRPDLLVRRRSDGALFIVNLKTTKKADERWVSQWPLDAQTLSEVVAVEERLNGELWVSETPPLQTIKLSGVIILGLLKGEQLQYPVGSGNWYHNSPLIWAWHNESGKAHPRGEWSARYEWKDDEGNHRLGKGWVKREIWLHYLGGVKEWIRHLSETDPAILEEQVVQLPPILRSEQQIESWKRTVIGSETRIRRARAVVEAGPPLNTSGIDELFPMSTSSGNCLWPGKCFAFPICHENASPDDEILYQIRVPNHPQEQF